METAYVPTPDSHLQFPGFALDTAGSVMVGHGFSSAQNMAACHTKSLNEAEPLSLLSFGLLVAQCMGACSADFTVL